MPLSYFLSKRGSLREYLPLEQGLRHGSIPLKYLIEPLREYLPLEQGLRHPIDTDTDFNILSESIFH